MEWGTIDASVTAAERDYLQDVLLPSAVTFWADALRVDRVDGNLHAGRECVQRFPSTNQCYEYETPTCSGVTIPTDMFKQQVGGWGGRAPDRRHCALHCTLLFACARVAPARVTHVGTRCPSTHCLCACTGARTSALNPMCAPRRLVVPGYPTLTTCCS